jgi:hypothetical protein
MESAAAEGGLPFFRCEYGEQQSALGFITERKSPGRPDRDALWRRPVQSSETF